MRRFKTLTLMAILALAAFGVSVAADAEETYKENFNKVESIAPDGKVSVSVISGDIIVKTWDKAEVKIDAVKSSRASSMDKAKENAQKVPIEVTKTAAGLEIKVKYPEGRHERLNVSVDFNLMIPAKAGLDTSTVSGNVTVEKIGGSLKAGSVSGDVKVTAAAKGVDAHTVSGDVTVSDIVGDAYVKSVSGNVSAERIAGSISAETVSGDVILTGISEAKTVSAKGLSGEVRYTGKISKDGRYTFKSHSGDVNVAIPAGSAFEFSADTFSGDINTDFKVETTGTISKKELHGTVNGGGAVLTLSSFSGDITLKKS